LVARAAAAVGASRRLSLAYALLLLWLQLPIGAVALAFDKLAPALERATTLRVFSVFGGGSSSGSGGGGYPAAVGGGAGALPSDPSAQLWAGLRMLTFTGVLSAETAAAVADVCADGWVLLALVFLATPGGFLTQMGCLLAGMAWPAACSALLVGATGARPLQRQVLWCKYWACYASLLHAGHELERVGVWKWAYGGHHAHLMLVVWLQLPYFRGAPRLHALAVRKLSAAFLQSSTTQPPPPPTASDEADYPPTALRLLSPSKTPASGGGEGSSERQTPLPARVDELKED